MLTTIMKWIAMITLTLSMPLWQSGPNVRLMLGFVISLAALMVAWQAIRAVKYTWAGAFYGIALLFNPLLVVAPPSGWFVITAMLASVIAFGFSLTRVPTMPLLSIPSITSLRARRSSL